MAYPVRDVQERTLAFHELMTGNGLSYSPFVLTTAFRFPTTPDEDAIRSTLNALTRRHRSLRAGFERSSMVSGYLRKLQLTARCRTGLSLGGLYEQRIHESVSPDLQLAKKVTAHNSEEFGAVLEGDIRRPCDFSHPPALLRVRLVALPSGEQVLILVVSHLVADLWSLAILEREFVLLYRGFAMHSPQALPRIELDHVAFTLRERERLSCHHYAKSLAFWEDKWSLFGGSQLRREEIEPSPPLGAGNADTSAITETIIDGYEAERIKEICRAMRLTPHMFFRVAICVALHLMTNRQRIAVGGNFANREYSTRHAVGWFNNRHLIWSEISSSTTWLDLACSTRVSVAQAIRHQEVPLQAVWHALGRSWDANGYRITATIDYHVLPTIKIDGVIEVDRHFLRQWTYRWLGFDLDIRVWNVGDSYKIIATYHANHYRGRTMEALLKLVSACARTFAAHPADPVVKCRP